MKVDIYTKGRDGNYCANGVYEDGKVIVKKGSIIRQTFANHIKGGQKARSYRDDLNFVDEKGNVLKDCEFDSPSTAAQFVCGTSTNGYIKWHVMDGSNLSKYLGRTK